MLAPPPPAPSKSDEDNTGAIVGGVVGGCAAPLFGALGWYMYKKKKAKPMPTGTKTVPADSVSI